jgi:hypothetical protein
MMFIYLPSSKASNFFGNFRAMLDDTGVFFFGQLNHQSKAGNGVARFR